MARRPPPSPLEGPLSPAELRRLGALAGRMPLACTATPRRRRFLFLGLAAPGFLAVFGAPLHQNFAVLIAGFGLFGAACLFRGRTERVFVHAEAAALWPPVAADISKKGGSTMRNRLAVFAVGIVLGLTNIAPAPAEAQVAVIDLKSILQAEKQVSQGLTEIQRLESQLANQAQMLQHLETNVTGPLTQITGQAQTILQQAQGLGYGGQNIAKQFQQLYPSSMNGASFAQTQGALASWRQTTSQTLQQAMTLQNQIVSAQPTTTSAVSSAVTASQGAAGQTSAIQATNQLLAAVSTQLTQLQSLLITEARAQQVAQAQAQATQAAGQADSQRFWSTPAPATRVQNPGQL